MIRPSVATLMSTDVQLTPVSQYTLLMLRHLISPLFGADVVERALCWFGADP